jgi:hypothetical protein
MHLIVIWLRARALGFPCCAKENGWHTAKNANISMAPCLTKAVSFRSRKASQHKLLKAER